MFSLVKVEKVEIFGNFVRMSAIINLAPRHLKALTGQSGESGDIWELCQDVCWTEIIPWASGI
jgi:hypothetical protein